MRNTLLALLCGLPPALAAAQGRDLAWREDWPRFRTSEYVITGLAVAGSAANFYLVIPPESPAWKGEILFDRAARNTLLIRSPERQDSVKKASDLMTFALMGYAMIDGPLTARWAGSSKDTAIQLALLNAETFAVTEVLNLTISNFLPRKRPDGAVCDPATKYDPHCVKSFWSGHAANAFAAASLVCAEHAALPLYGGVADPLACGASLSVAAAVSALRIATNNHHASDVLAGAAVGAATGYLMPNLLHFRFKGTRGRLGYLIPQVGPHGGGLTFIKSW